MKKLLVVLLSLGLIAAFSMTASAADVKFSGQYYVAGVYDNNPLLKENSFSQAYFYQRVRIKPVFQVAEGLSFTVQFDAIEKQWGDSAWRRNAVGGEDTQSSKLQAGGNVVAVASVGPPVTTVNAAGATGAANRGVQENVEFDQAYVTFNTAIGQVQIGYQDADVWGTAFGNTPTTRPRAQIASKFGNFTTMLIYEKFYETVVYQRGIVDGDNDTYALAGIYKAGAIEAGLLYKFFVQKANRVAGGSTKTHLVSPYAKATFGPVFVEAEVNYMFGKAFASEVAGVNDIDAASWSAYLNGNMKFGPATVGALFGMATGNDFTADKSKALLHAGYGWNPALILMNDDLNWWGGSGLVPGNNVRSYISPAGGNGMGGIKKNSVWYNLYAAYTVTPKLGLTAALTYATVETKKLSATTEAVSDKLGWEFDMTASYKIFDNLSYMVGAGYLWSGDYFKLANAAAKVENNYVLTNKLTLNF